MTAPGARIFHGWLVVAAVHVLLLTIFGATYSFSSFFTPITAEFGATRASVSFTFALAVFLYFTVGAIVGPIADRVPLRKVTCSGIVALSGGLWMASEADSLLALYVWFGIGIGLGVGACYVPAISAVQPWFIKRRGMAAGLASAGIGLGTLVVPVLASQLVESHGWRASLKVIAGSALLVGLFAAWMIEKSPSARGLHPDNDPTSRAPDLAKTGMNLGDALRTLEFRFMFLALLAVALVQFMPFVHLARHAVDRGFSPNQGALLVGLIGVGSFVGRFAFAGFADRLGFVRMLALCFGVMCVAFTIWLASLPLAPSLFALALFALLLGLGYGGYVGIAPALAMQYFGGKNLAGIIGALYFAAGLGTLFSPTFAGWAYDRTGSYVLPIASGIVVSLIAIALVLRLPREPALNA